MNSQAHWLTAVVSRAGGDLSAWDPPKSGTPIEEAWEMAARLLEVEEGALADIVAAHFHLPRADINLPEKKALKLVSEEVARSHLVLPLRENYRRLVFATADPTNLEAEDAVVFSSGRSVTMEIALPGEIKQAIDSHYSPEKAVAQILSKVGAEVDDSIQLIEEETPDVPSLDAAAMGPVVNLTNIILKEAVEARASDIHLQPTAQGGMIRYRIDGVMRTTGTMPLPVLTRVVSRVKIIGKLDIADHLRPQDGKAKVAFGDRVVELRISTVPTRYAEKVVIRILDPEEARTLSETGLLDQELARFRHMLSHREGIVVVTGPTGSGKTTTLYAALRHIHNDETNIITVEDPVEYELPGLTQIQVEPKQGVTFASALRAILRQDPDVLFVGEIRDTETATIAAQASLTGHLVLSTLHTNDVVGSIGRFLDLGLDPNVLADTFKGAVAQRLVRKVCGECAIPIEDALSMEEELLAEGFGVRPPLRIVGCDACGGSGYQGRLPLVEVLPITPSIRKLIGAGGDSLSIAKTAREEGFRSLREVGAILVSEGATTLHELERVLGDVGEGAGQVRLVGGRPADSEERRRVAGPDQTDSEPDDMGDATRILVVDDDLSDRTVARALLEVEGYQVHEALDGVEAVEALNGNGRFNLAILDLEMPRMGGRDLLKEIRGNIATVGLPVVVLTGASDPAMEITLMEEGADDYIRKPFDPKRFTIRVKAALRRAGGH